MNATVHHLPASGRRTELRPVRGRAPIPAATYVHLGTALGVLAVVLLVFVAR